MRIDIETDKETGKIKEANICATGTEAANLVKLLLPNHNEVATNHQGSLDIYQLGVAHRPAQGLTLSEALHQEDLKRE